MRERDEETIKLYREKQVRGGREADRCGGAIKHCRGRVRASGDHAPLLEQPSKALNWVLSASSFGAETVPDVIDLEPDNNNNNNNNRPGA